MAVGSLAVALDPAAPRPYKNGRAFEQSVIITVTGNYATGGVVLDLTGLNTPGLSIPFRSQFVSNATTPTGQTYIYNPGTDRSDGKVMSFAGATEDADDSSWPDTTIKATFWYKGSQ